MLRIALRLILLGLLSHSGCAARAPRAATASDVSRTRDAGEPRTEHVARADEPALDACAGQHGLVIEPTVPIAADWQGAATVGGRGEATVRWCGAGTVSIVSLTLGHRDVDGDLGEVRSIRTPDPLRARLTRGGSLTDELWAPSEPAALLLVVDAIAEDGETIRARAQLESVEDPERIALRTECQAAGGTWAARGMTGSEQCDRPTSDAGQRCTSDADCEGPCVDAGSEPLSDAPAAGLEMPACGPGRQPHLLVGRCHDRSVRFGCHPRLHEVTIECVAPAFRRRAHGVCVD
ncbi:MAG: hypothetical protein M3Y87_35360 [Myxococcota bacterium]|nr:hypothetical protein [Myxococcota bacterium]